MGISKVTRNCQVTIPKDVRRQLNVREGDEMHFVIEGERIILQRPVKDPIMAAAGAWRGMKETGLEYQKRIRSQWKKRQKALQW